MNSIKKLVKANNSAATYLIDGDRGTIWKVPGGTGGGTDLLFLNALVTAFGPVITVTPTFIDDAFAGMQSLIGAG